MTNQSHYFLSPVLVYEDSSLKLALHRALVSGNGIYKVFEDSEELQRAFHEAKTFRVQLDGQEFSARLIRETSVAGTHYNLSLNGEERLGELVRRFGFESPWRRGFARIPSSEVYAQCEAPVGAVLLHQHTSAEVRNFSYHGLFLNLHTPAGESVGQRIQFKLMTSKGKLLETATGRIARVYDEMLAPGLLKRGIGVRLVELPEQTQKIYYGMILDACRELHGK